MKKRFREVDRRQVIGKLESHLGVRLSPIPGFRKHFSGTDGNKYCIVGGIDDWHGIPKEIVNDSDSEKTVIVIARLLKDRIEVFVGGLLPFINSKKKLTINIDGDYQFDIRQVMEDRMYIKQLHGYCLKKIFHFAHDTEAARTREKNIDNTIKRLSPEKKAELYKLLGLDS